MDGFKTKISKGFNIGKDYIGVTKEFVDSIIEFSKEADDFQSLDYPTALMDLMTDAKFSSKKVVMDEIEVTTNYYKLKMTDEDVEYYLKRWSWKESLFLEFLRRLEDEKDSNMVYDSKGTAILTMAFSKPKMKDDE